MLNCLYCRVHVDSGVICPDCLRKRNLDLLNESIARCNRLIKVAVELGDMELVGYYRSMLQSDLREIEAL